MDFLSNMQLGGKVILGLFLLMAIVIVISLLTKKKGDK